MPLYSVNTLWKTVFSQERLWQDNKSSSLVAKIAAGCCSTFSQLQRSSVKDDHVNIPCKYPRCTDAFSRPPPNKHQTQIWFLHILVNNRKVISSKIATIVCVSYFFYVEVPFVCVVCVCTTPPLTIQASKAPAPTEVSAMHTKQFSPHTRQGGCHPW